jgi:HEAT repeat protein
MFVMYDQSNPRPHLQPGSAMRSASRFAFGLALVVGTCALGCGKNAGPAPVPPDAPAVKEKPEPSAAEVAAARRAKYLSGLRSNTQKTRELAIDELSFLIDEDPAVLPALVELLRDKGTAGSNHTYANQVNSTREAAARALMLNTKGEAALTEKGLAVLREGLTDPNADVREHTAYTLGQLGVLARPLAADVQKLCTDKDENVRGVAFDALRALGVADPVALAKQLTHPEEDVVRLSVELLRLLPEVPDGAVEPLTAALALDNSNLRAAAAAVLAAAGPKAAPAAPKLEEVIRKTYPDEFDPKTAPRPDGPEAAYWRALARIGAPAVPHAAKLLAHKNLQVRALAAKALGEVGPPAKPAADALKKALTDPTVNVAAEAAVALVLIGLPADESLELMKRAIDAPNEGIAAYAIDALPRMGAAGKGLIAHALGKLNAPNSQTKYAALVLAAQVPPEEARKVVAEIGKLATDDQPEVRRAAGRVLERLGPNGAGAAGALGTALATETELDVRNQFVEALLAMGASAKPALAGMLPLVADGGLSVTVRAKVAVALAAADPASPQVSAALVKAAGDADPTVRAGAAKGLGKLDPLSSDALAALTKMAKADAKDGARVAALTALAAAGPRAQAAKPDLEAIAAGKQPWLALRARVALCALAGDVRKAAPDVRRALADKGAQTRAAAVDGLLLVGVSNDDVPALLRLIKDVNAATKAATAHALARVGPGAQDAVPDLVRALDHAESEVRVAAADALGAIGRAAKPGAAKLRELRADPLVRPAALRALEKIDN